VPIAVEVANALNADLEVIVVRKLALPLNPEGGLGAVADDGTSILNEDIIQKDGLSREQIEYEAGKIKANVKQRSLKYMGDKLRLSLTGKTAIIVDDGLASGITMEVAVESVKHRRPRDIIVAVPVSSAAGYNRAAKVANKVVTCAVASMPVFYLADFYRHWQDIGDDAVVHYLEQWRQRHSM
jgi:putative phosphoribosyl transferase